MDEELKRLEEELAKLSPRAASQKVLTRMDYAMGQWHREEEQETLAQVVPFPELSSQREPQRQGMFGPSWRIGAAAALAISGAFSAASLQVGSRADTTDVKQKPTARAVAAPTEGRRAEITSNVVRASDGGLMASPLGQQSRCLVVETEESYAYQTPDGEQRMVKEPHTHLYFLPLKID